MLERRGIIDLVLATRTADVLLPLGLALLLGASACARREPPSELDPEGTGVTRIQPTQTDLPFDTIEKEMGIRLGAEPYEAEDPLLIVVSAREQVSALKPSLSPEAQSELSSTKFGDYFVVAVFQGRKPTFDYGVDIQRVVLQDETIKVFAEFVEPTEGQMLHLADSSPYHAVRVERCQGLADREIQFILIANGRETASSVHRLR